MRSFDINENNDLFLSGRPLALVSNAQAIGVVAKCAARSILGEMVLAKDQGMPYFETVWVGNPTAAPFEAAFRARVSAIPGVSEIKTLETEQLGDVFQYRAEIVTVYGVVAING